MRIPHNQLPPETLQAVVLEFVTRDGTDHSLIEQRVATVLRQLETGIVEVDFDSQSETCNILLVDHAKSDCDSITQRRKDAEKKKKKNDGVKE